MNIYQNIVWSDKQEYSISKTIKRAVPTMVVVDVSADVLVLSVSGCVGPQQVILIYTSSVPSFPV